MARTRMIHIWEQTYVPFYKFDGGEYFIPQKTIHGAEAWIALMDDGSLQMLVGGKHHPYNVEYVFEDSDVQKVRKYNGKYRVYSVYNSRSHGFESNGLRVDEVRYGTKVDALDYQERMGGELCWEEYDDRAEAQRILDEKKGDMWW